MRHALQGVLGVMESKAMAHRRRHGIHPEILNGLPASQTGGLLQCGWTVIDEVLAEVYLRHVGRISFDGAQRAPDDVLADKGILLRSLLAEACGAAKDARITRLFLQCRELMSAPDAADPAAVKRLAEELVTENR